MASSSTLSSSSRSLSFLSTETQIHTDIIELFTEPEKHLEQIVQVSGWIQFIRWSGKNKLCFIKLKDGSCLEHLQIVFNAESLKNGEFDILEKAGTGTSMSIGGKFVKSLTSGQSYEMQAEDYHIYGQIKDPDTYPIAKNELPLEFLRTVPHLRIRTDTFSAIARIKSVMKHAFDDYFESLRFHEVQVPLITDNECESGANPFTVTTLMRKETHDIPAIYAHPSYGTAETRPSGVVDFEQDFFKKRTYLTVSGQLHLETLVLGGLSKAYCWTTAFRAEPSTGPRHLAEFWMLELEFCFSSLEDNINVNEGCIKHALSTVLKKCRPELEFLQAKFKRPIIEQVTKYSTKPFIVSSHQECVELMLADIKNGKVKIDSTKKPDGDISTFKEAPTLDGDLSKDHERYITEVLFNGMPVFVRYFPAKIKSFYMPKIDKGAPVEHVDGFDLLFPEIGEIVGGSQRESDYDTLIARMKEMGVDPKSLQFYADLRKYGTVPHGGSGIGFDRLMMICTGIFNIKDMIPFPRSYESCLY